MPTLLPRAAPELEAGAALRPIVDAELDRLLRRGVGLRAGVAPLLAVVAAVVVWIDPEPWRQALLTALAALAVVGAWWSARRVRRLGVSAVGVTANFVAMAVLQLGMVGATGGLASPLLPVMLPLCIVASLILGERPGLLGVLAVQLLGLLLLLLGQVTETLPDLRLALLVTSQPSLPLELATVFVVMAGLLVAGAALGRVLRITFEHMVGDALAARESQLATIVGQAKELELLSGEIAHELKNPLASIKGLSALLARDVPLGRAQERLEVMRGEVDRMQLIIEDFLTFSRPLSPLSLDPVDPQELCRHVAALHEAEALKRRVGLEVEAGGPSLRGDHRKLSQVLVNLLQNALEVAPPGSAVRVVARAEGHHLIFEVADRGPGPAPELGDRVFEPGVSDKPKGSGLGLTIARALARQHGGELSLEARPGGGAVARLRLPQGGPP